MTERQEWDGDAYQQRFDAIYPKLAQKYGVPLYPFFLDGVTGVAGMRLPDGLHPNAAGVDRMVERFLPAFEKAKEPVYAGFARVPVAATAAVMAPETPAVSRCSSA